MGFSFEFSKATGLEQEHKVAINQWSCLRDALLRDMDFSFEFLKATGLE